jgi:predicted transposase YdaD
MAQSYDVTFKLLFRKSRGLMSKLLFGDVVEWPNVELPEVRNPRVDLLAKCADGSYRHVELQLRNEAQLSFRMLDYYVGIRRVLGVHPQQILLYAGRQPLPNPGVFQSPSTRHEFTVINLCEMDGEDLLASDDWADNEWALLTKSDPEKVMRVVLEKLRLLSGEEQEIATTSFVILSGIIGMEEEVERRLNTAMIDIMENKVLGPAIRKGLEQGRQLGRQEGREEGREEGRALERRELLRDLLEDRFGKLPAWAETKIAAAAPETLKSWSLQVHRVDSLADLFS